MKRIVALVVVMLLCGRDVFATRRALIFGLGKQQDSSWGKINGDNDVYYLERVLCTIGYTDIVKLRNEEATKAAMVQAFTDLAGRCRKDDVVYIHYSGHGQLMTDLDGDECRRWGKRQHAGWDESWIPYDAYMTYGHEDKGDKHLCDDELAQLLTGIRRRIGKKGTLIVVVDACHSGDATCGEEDEPVRGVDMKFIIPRNPQQAVTTTPSLPERWLTISACRPYQLCTEMKQPKVGKLTYAICQLGEALHEMDRKQIESYLNDFMDNNKGRLPQNPMLTGRKQ